MKANFFNVLTFLTLSLSAGSFSLALPSQAEESPAHGFDFSTRLRYVKLSSGDGVSKNDGRAASILLRLGLKSSWHENVSTYLEVDHVSTTYQDEHSDAVRFNGRPFVIDVPGTEVNQVWIRASLREFDMTLGRQAIEFDDQRFIGSNSFWQNNQTFDAVQLQLQWLSASKVSYAYLFNVNRILGDDADEDLRSSDSIYNFYSGQRPATLWGDHKLKTHLLRVEFNEWDYSQWVNYAYLIDNRDEPSRSADTLGSRYDFHYQPGAFKYRIEAEFALQKSHGRSSTEKTHYSKMVAGLGYRSLEISTRVERFSATSGVSFSTSLGSLHDFQGWADRFPRAPADGLLDTSLKIKWRHAPWKIDFRYHRFQATEASQKYGHEFDVDFIFKVGKKHKVQLRIADFKTDDDSSGVFRDEKRAFFNYSYNL